jgi:type VI secretion system protein ImpE
VEAQRLYKEGKLSEAIARVQEELRSDPQDVSRRTFLFELLCFQGEFERARKQLEVIEAADPASYLGTMRFRQVLRAEGMRQEMFRTGALPDRRDEDPSVAGTLNGTPFGDLRDADPRIGPRLEMIAGGQYVWIPFMELSAVRIQPPALLRDLLWATAEVEIREREAGDTNDVVLPAMTALSWQSPDELVRLGRVTTWAELDTGEETPVGQKLLLVDDEEFPILEVRELIIHHV